MVPVGYHVFIVSVTVTDILSANSYNVSKLYLYRKSAETSVFTADCVPL